MVTFDPGVPEVVRMGVIGVGDEVVTFDPGVPGVVGM